MVQLYFTPLTELVEHTRSLPSLSLSLSILLSFFHPQNLSLSPLRLISRFQSLPIALSLAPSVPVGLSISLFNHLQSVAMQIGAHL